MKQNNSLTSDIGSAVSLNLRIIDPIDLPVELLRQLTPLQRLGLAFASRGHEVLDAQVNTIHDDSGTTIPSRFAGSTQIIRGESNVLGSVGSASHKTTHPIQTEIDLNVEDIQIGDRFSLKFILPFSLAIPIVAGDVITIFYVVGGLPKPMVKGDFKLREWTPFAARNSSTRQVVPLCSIPTLSEPFGMGLLISGMFLIGVGLLLFFAGLTQSPANEARGAAFFFSLSCFILSTLPFLYRASIRRRWKHSFDEAKRFVAGLKHLGGLPQASFSKKSQD